MASSPFSRIEYRYNITLYVQTNCDTTAASGQYTKGLRPISIRYPNGRCT